MADKEMKYMLVQGAMTVMSTIMLTISGWLLVTTVGLMSDVAVLNEQIRQIDRNTLAITELSRELRKTEIDVQKIYAILPKRDDYDKSN